MLDVIKFLAQRNSGMSGLWHWFAKPKELEIVSRRFESCLFLMADIWYNWDDPNWITVICDECGPFTASVYKHNDDLRFLIQEEIDHRNKYHGGK